MRRHFLQLTIIFIALWFISLILLFKSYPIITFILAVTGGIILILGLSSRLEQPTALATLPKLGKAQKYYKGALQLIPNPIVIFKKNGEIIFCNAAAQQHFPLFKLGASILMYFRDKDLLHQIHNCQTADKLIYQYDKKTINNITYLIKILQIEEKYFLASFKDISVNLEQQLKQADFIKNAGHELKTPITIISGFLETIRYPEELSKEDYNKFINIMLNETQQLNKLTNNLLTLAQLDNKFLIQTEEEVNINLCIENIITSYSKWLTQNNIQIALNTTDKQLSVLGSGSEIHQIFKNLVSNAIKYSQAGSLININIKLSEDNKYLITSIQDQGIGIDKAEIAKLTQPFYRGSNTGDRPGTGLGLAIAHKIIAKYNGRLEISSQPNKGSCFTIYWPRTSKK